MKLIVGLGNPGEKYVSSRHNLGFMILERFFEDISPEKKTNWHDERKFRSVIASFDWNRKDGTVEQVYIGLPTTFMNSSGVAVQLLTQFYQIAPADVWVVYDELDLPLGSMKIRMGGAAAGHRGVENIIETLGTDAFWRFRMGIGSTKTHIPRSTDESDGQKITLARIKMHDASDFVLGNFDETQQTELKHLLKEGSQALQFALEHGIESAQNRFNTK